MLVNIVTAKEFNSIIMYNEIGQVQPFTTSCIYINFFPAQLIVASSRAKGDHINMLIFYY